MKVENYNVNPSSKDFLTKSSFPEKEWNSYSFQIRNLINDLDNLKDWIGVTSGEEQAINKTKDKYKWSISPYYASLIDKHNPNCPIRLQCVPNLNEISKDYLSNSDIDPVGDVSNLKTARIVHKYPNRVVFLVANNCFVYCRHCTRKFHTTDKTGTYYGDNYVSSFKQDIDYIRNHPEINDVLLTGGDPLSLSDKILESIIKELRSIPHVNIIRIGSRFPVFLPQRITDELCDMLAKYHPFYLNTHFNHPVEITEESTEAINKLLKRGIIVQNQSVLMKGINDSVEIMKELVDKLLSIRVRPYYIYHCDNTSGVSHFRTSIEKGMEIMEGLTGHTTGFAVPQYVITTKLGKIPVAPKYFEKIGKNYIIRNYKNQSMDITDYLSLPDS